MYNSPKNALEEYDYAIDTIDDAVVAEHRESRDFFPKNLTDTLPLLGRIKDLKSQYEKKLSALGIGKAHQKIRICEDDETTLRVSILVSLLVIVTLAICATYRLHRIADYKVNLNKFELGKCVIFTLFIAWALTVTDYNSRSSFIHLNACLAAYQAPVPG